MKKIRKYLALLFALVLILSLCASAFADGTSYTVRLYGGDSAVGELKAGGVVMQTVADGDSVTFTEDMVEVKDKRYYPKGFREAGHDNNPLITFGAKVKITRDTDFVIAYGMKSTAVKYTVRYRHATTGVDLIGAQTFYGNVGDKPVVAFLYLENYMPQAYNLTKTLSATESENEFIFLYEPIPQVQNNGAAQVVPGANNNANANANANANNNANANANNNANANANNNAGANANANANAGTNEGANANANANANAGTNEGANANANEGANANANAGANTGEAEGTAPTVPEEIIDLDVPLAGPGQQQGEPGSGPFSGLSKAVYAAVGLVILALAGIPLFFFLKRRKTEKKEKQGMKPEEK